MPVATCSKCGGVTNTAVCEHDMTKIENVIASKCYAKFNMDTQRWEKGCAYGEVTEEFMRHMADRLIHATEEDHANDTQP
jgi:RecJ-like exonuclease